ncbi:MAG: futalosine hydrolase [Vulcanimicrobiaceae bacterium]
MILVVCALREELQEFSDRDGVAVLACGVGPVEAAIAVARTLAGAPYRCVINAGIGGAFPGAARVGEARLVTTEYFADLGLEGGAPLTLPGGAAAVDRVDADPGLLAQCGGAAPPAVGLTVSQVTTSAANGARLRARYRADIESMEGFAVLRAAAGAGVPALEVRGISNYVGDRGASEWNFAAGARATTHALEAVLARLTLS